MPYSSLPLSKRPRALALTAAVIVSTLALAGCASSSPADKAAANSSGFPVTIVSKLGSTTIESAPKRVAAISWSNQDVAIGLGVVPVTMPFATYGDNDKDGYLPWTYDALKKLTKTMPKLHNETDGMPFEAISGSKPDVIIGAYSGMSAEDFSTLNKIAPTVAYPTQAWATSWRDATLIDAKAMGKTAEAKIRIAAVEKQMATEVAKYPRIKGKTVAYLAITSSSPDSISYYTPEDARVKYVNELGLTNSPTIVALSKGSSQFYGTISAENADTIDADIVIMYLDDDKALDSIKNSALLSQIPAVKRGSVVTMIDPTFIASTSGPSLLSIPWSLDKYVGLIAAAAAKV